MRRSKDSRSKNKVSSLRVLYQATGVDDSPKTAIWKPTTASLDSLPISTTASIKSDVTTVSLPTTAKAFWSNSSPSFSKDSIVSGSKSAPGLVKSSSITTGQLTSPLSTQSTTSQPQTQPQPQPASSTTSTIANNNSSSSNYTAPSRPTSTATTANNNNISNGTEATSKLAEALDDFLGDVERKFKGISEEILARLDEMTERCDRLEGELLRRETRSDGGAA